MMRWHRSNKIVKRTSSARRRTISAVTCFVVDVTTDEKTEGEEQEAEGRRQRRSYKRETDTHTQRERERTLPKRAMSETHTERGRIYSGEIQRILLERWGRRCARASLAYVEESRRELLRCTHRFSMRVLMIRERERTTRTENKSHVTNICHISLIDWRHQSPTFDVSLLL